MKNWIKSFFYRQGQRACEHDWCEENLMPKSRSVIFTIRFCRKCGLVEEEIQAYLTVSPSKKFTKQHYARSLNQ